MGILPKKEGGYPKRDIDSSRLQKHHWSTTKARYRLQSLLTDYKRLQKVRHRLQSLLIDYKSWTYTTKYTNRIKDNKSLTYTTKFTNRLQKTTKFTDRIQKLDLRLQNLLIPSTRQVCSVRFLRLQRFVVHFSDMWFVVSLTFKTTKVCNVCFSDM